MPTFEERAKILINTKSTGNYIPRLYGIELFQKADTLIAAQKELIEFYQGHLDNMAGFLDAHTLRAKPEEVEKGKRLRAKIEELSR